MSEFLIDTDFKIFETDDEVVHSLLNNYRSMDVKAVEPNTISHNLVKGDSDLYLSYLQSADLYEPDVGYSPFDDIDQHSILATKSQSSVSESDCEAPQNGKISDNLRPAIVKCTIKPKNKTKNGVNFLRRDVLQKNLLRTLRRHLWTEFTKKSSSPKYKSRL